MDTDPPPELATVPRDVLLVSELCVGRDAGGRGDSSLFFFLPPTTMPTLARSPPSLQPTQTYARTLAVSVAASPSLATTLTSTVPTVTAAYGAAWDEAAAAAAAAAAAPPEWALAFTHTCANVGCREPGCILCAHNPARACATTLASKCLAGDALRSACGSDAKLELVHLPTLMSRGGSSLLATCLNSALTAATLSAAEASGLPPPPRHPADAAGELAIELTVLDGRAYDALLAAGRGGDGAAIAATALPTNKAGDPLLAGGRVMARSAAGGALLRAAAGGSTTLVDVCVTGSSESLLSGQKPPFRLAARAVYAATGVPIKGIAIAVSDPFVVATPRVRSAVKADVPVVTDHVSKLNAVGPQTVAKLADVSAAAAAAGLPPLDVPHVCVTTVGEFRDVVAAAAGNPDLTDALKRALKLTKGWDAAAAHAAAAVERDTLARVWWRDAEGRDGLAYGAALGAIDVARPAAVVSRGHGDASTVTVTPLTRLPPKRAADAAAAAAAAAAAWGVPRHPGWALWSGVYSDDLAAAVATGGDATLPAPPTSGGRGGGGSLPTLAHTPGGALADAAAARTAAAKRGPVPPSPFEAASPPPAKRAALGTTLAPTRAGVSAAALQAHLSTLVGRALTGGDMARLVPSFPVVSAADDIFLSTGLSALEFSPSELAKMDAWPEADGGGAPLTGAQRSGPLLRFLADRLTAAPGSGGYGAPVGEPRPSGLEAHMSGLVAAMGGGGGGSGGGGCGRPLAPMESEAPLPQQTQRTRARNGYE